MSPQPPNPHRPVPPSSPRPGKQSDDAPEGLTDEETCEDENPADFTESAQPDEEDGVSEDMASLAVNPGVLEDVLPPSVAQGSAHFHEMEDSAIMLELSAGNMSGFDFLIQKYRKPIIKIGRASRRE